MGPPDPASLGALTVELPLDSSVDPYAAAGAGGVVLASPERRLSGWGTAAVVPLPGGLGDPGGVALVCRWLAEIGAEDRVGLLGCGVVAFGALPFDRRAPGALVVPRLVTGCDGRRSWATLVGPRDEVTEGRLRAELGPLPRAAAARSDGLAEADGPPTAAPADTEERPDGPSYQVAVTTALAAIARHDVEKVVLSRSFTVNVPPPYPAAELVRRLHDQEPSCTAFAVPVPGGLFVGATPELLVERWGDLVHCLPLAGTAPLGGTPEDDDAQEARLLGSDKDRREHRPAVEAIRSTLAPWCSALSVAAAPAPARFRSVVHLATDIRGVLGGEGADRPDVLELLAALHPTPAVGGWPTPAALSLLERLEPVGRGPWAGPVGWVDAAGDGQWLIGIRSALIRPGGAQLWAGAGIVEGSQPLAELAETTMKLRPVLQALYPGSGRLLSATR